MKVSTAANWKDYFLNKLSVCYSWNWGQAYDDILADRQKEIYDHPAWRKCPSWVKHRVWQVSEVKLKQLYHRDVMWLFPPSDGGMPLPLNGLTDEDRQAVFDGKISGGHYWMKCKTDKLPDGTIIDTYSPTLRKFS